MSQLCQRTFALAAVLCVTTLVLVPTGYVATVALAGSAVAKTGPTLPPYPWEGLAAVTAPAATGPTLPPYPWCG
jgi:hypothetical protein